MSERFSLRLPVRELGAFLWVCLLAACGGGGGDSDSPSTPAPTISAQPQSQSVQTDGQATYSVTATGSGLGYQWKRNGTAIPGATLATYTTAAATFGDSGAQYTVTVTNAGGSVTSTAAALTLALSADQQASEAFNVAPGTGSHILTWNLNYAGPETSGVNYAYSSVAGVIVSPLTNGPQTNQQSVQQNLTTTLALPASTPTRVLKAGTILVVPDVQASNRISYVGGNVRVDSLAADNTTIALSQTRSSFALVPLAGAVTATPGEMAHFYNSFFSNPAILTTGVNYTAGAAYLKYTATALGDRYTVFDCHAATTDANVTACVEGTTINALLTAGYASASDGVTYHLADGAVSTVGGIQVWIATQPRPQSATLSATVQYRTYFELAGNVYTGSFVKDGTVLGGSYWVSNPAGAAVTDRLTFLSYQMRLNQAARDSLKAAMAI